jgi:hypothetical protein
MSTDITTAQPTAQSIFNALASNIPNVTITGVSAQVTDGMARTATVNYTATTPTVFMGMIGISSMTLSGQATAQSAVSTYIDFYLLLDNTPSMGVGATPGDVGTMVNNTPDQCAFACHDLNNSNNYYNLAKKLNVTMRIDVVRSATQNLMDTATSAATYPNQYRMAIYTFGSSAATAGLTTVTPLTSDQDTNFDGIFPNMDTAIPPVGPGTAASPQKVFLFVSDGVADENLNGKRVISPLNASLCANLKSRGVKIAVLYTTYLPLPTNTFYNQNVKPFVNNIGPAMQSCASPGLYFEVSPTQGISDAMIALFQMAATSARLTK